jgi:hypothetical protein
MLGVLKFSVCPSGLRIGIMRIFGPFCRDFLVPWNEITVTRSDRVFWTVAKLSFGQPLNGNLKVYAVTPNATARPPIVVAILVPAIVFGIGPMVQYFRRQRP